MFFKSKRFLAAGMLLSMMAFAAAGCGGGDKKADAPKKDAAKVYNVGIVQLVEHQALDDSRKGFIEGIDGYSFQRPENNVYNIDIYTDNSVIVMYINDVCAYTQRIYGIQKNCWSINNYGGNITVSDVKVSQQ
jgi:ABC-type uncharacterized transport system substrate-binding protein